ncbi:MAG: TolC family protein [Roseivirga sp.]|nr:TolC family protein [Roseivirga sp.]
MIRQRYIFLLLSLAIGLQLQAQEILSKGEAISEIMANNFNVVISKKSIEIAENNTSIYNTGYLPTVTGSAGINYNRDNLKVEFQDGRVNELDGATSDSKTANLNLNYVLFNGFNRKYNVQRNAESLNRAQLNARSILETALTNLFNAYYEVAQTQENLKSLSQTLAVSKERLTRAQYGFEYGQNSRLDVSNAQVDVNTDSINYLNAAQGLYNAKRNLNFLMGKREASIDFDVDTGLGFAQLSDKDVLKEQVLRENVTLLIARADQNLSRYDSRISKSNYFPTLSASAGYNYRKGNNNSASFLASNTSNGITGGVSLGWNIFDGGGTRTATQNAKVNEELQNYTVEQLTQQIQVNFENAWADYENKRFIVNAQENNLSTNQQNFERTQEQYKLGQVSSIDFRTAQSNLLRAQISLNTAKYDAKLAELLIFQLVGDIQQAEF